MSAPDQGDDKGFLARWSQRKQEAKEETKQPEPEAPVADAKSAAAPVAEAEAAPEFDLSSLPSLDELTSETDITAFLRKGVPEHLRNAALRKSWALDPAIRNYVNPALDYAYDWNTPGGVLGTGETPTEPPVSAAADPAESATDFASPGEPEPDLPEQPLRLSDQRSNPDEESSRETGQKMDSAGSEKVADSVAPQHVVRRHGSAKPTI
jgi:hypothetical protein